ncbi:GAF domain-containing SpoIIE family protein phosphatase [Mesoaciditoga lauensis]|uniref:GAF domain-containing SpoIIE family protein phosphatase n=1 Tax=Mesoaciditoga lauensis TaxID=1495039 RepID=UPI00068984E7|nr:SpoIIE family protein phosphatase [Mesoaciditoga lauensis]
MKSQEKNDLKKLYDLILNHYKEVGQDCPDLEQINKTNGQITIEEISSMFECLMKSIKGYRRELENASLMMEANLEEISNTYDLLSSLLEITNTLSKSVNPYDVALEVVDIIQKNIPSEEVVLFVLDEGEVKKFSHTKTDKAQQFFDSYMLTKSHKAVLDEKTPLMAIPIESENEFYGAFVCVEKKGGSFYNAADRKLVESTAKQLRTAFSNYRYFKAEVERAAIQRELSIAYDIQQHLFPKNFPEKFKVAGTSIPAHDVGGDYYDAFELDGKLFITIADVSGKGVPAALIMSSFRSYLKGIVQSGKSFSELINYFNHLISQDISEDRFVTAVVGIIDPIKSTFEYVNAGHDPIILSRNGELSFFEANGVPFGILDVPNAYQIQKIDLKKGDVLVMYTDGVAEARNTDNQEYGLERLNTLVKDFYMAEPSEMLQMIISDVADFSNGAKQHDDITVLVAKM